MASVPKKLSIVIVGDGGVGKSSITLSFIRREFSEEWDPTIEDSYTVNRTIDGQEYSIELIDTAGQEEYRGLWGDQTVQHGDAFIFVYSIDSKDSMLNLSEFLHIVRKVRSPTENPPLSNTPDNNPFVYAVLGNKCDLPPDLRQVSAPDGLNFARSGGGLFFETSAKARVNIDSAFDSIVRAVEKSRKAETAHKRVNRKDPFNPNVGYVASLASAAANSSDSDGFTPGPRSNNNNLKLDRGNSMSVGGLGDDSHKSKCCTIQ